MVSFPPPFIRLHQDRGFMNHGYVLIFDNFLEFHECYMFEPEAVYNNNETRINYYGTSSEQNCCQKGVKQVGAIVSQERENIFYSNKIALQRLLNTGSTCLGVSCNVSRERALLSTTNPSDIASVLNAKKFYKSCLNQNQIASEGIKPFKDIIDSFGGCPALNAGKFDESRWMLEDVVSRIQKTLGYGTILMGSLTADRENSDIMLFHLGQANFLLTKAQYSDSNTKFNFMVGVMQAISDNPQTVKQDMSAVLNLEKKLVQFSKNRDETLKREAYNKILYKNLDSTLSTKFNWKLYLNNIIPNYFVDDTPIVTTEKEYLIEMANIVQTTPKRTLANFVMWSVVQNMFNNFFLPAQLKAHLNTFTTVMTGAMKEVPIDTECEQMTAKYFAEPPSRIYVEKYFQQDIMNLVIDMVDRMVYEFKNLIRSNKWMDDSTKEEALVKLNLMSRKVGYPDYLFNNTFLESTYGKIQIDQKTKNILSLLKYGVEFAINMIFKPSDKTIRWTLDPITVNAQYNPQANDIGAQSMNYGAFGMFIGHEISHGFDISGKLYDGYGNMRNWWSNSSDVLYKEKTDCLVRKYNNFWIKQIGEYTYRNSMKKGDSAKEKLLGLQFTSDQLFFISFAQLWCEKMSNEGFQYSKKDEHSPNVARATVPLQNFEKFAFVFNCPKTSPMNPPDKCKIY
ncbi:hypothetical protein HELRODRAFT_177711 [Helobdella robusta]|uniref:Peptidase M13 C-terminal domain-containing protein n=1 Tax=Helobdella robusta TaxID=6412 RepID=T1FC43_HELRO|nr:hypothetical protein HELRODRAFT_177711 [Helobdella robusta]ESN97657.1 hypothetical protein HELRODRAFT_177711 [Helobdella robusta]